VKSAGRFTKSPFRLQGPAGNPFYLTTVPIGCVLPHMSVLEEYLEDETERKLRLDESLRRVRLFRHEFSELEQILPSLMETLPALLTKLYSDCQTFAETEIKSLLERLNRSRNPGLNSEKLKAER